MSEVLRRHVREAMEDVIRLTWVDSEDQHRMTRGRCLDISESGIRAEILDRVEPRLYVYFRLEKLKISGQASVRHCQRSGIKYVVGLEFSRGLHYKGKVSQHSA